MGLYGGERAVRKTIAEPGGTMPEELPMPGDTIQQVRHKEQASDSRRDGRRKPGR